MWIDLLDTSVAATLIAKVDAVATAYRRERIASKDLLEALATRFRALATSSTASLAVGRSLAVSFARSGCTSETTLTALLESLDTGALERRQDLSLVAIWVTAAPAANRKQSC